MGWGMWKILQNLHKETAKKRHRNLIKIIEIYEKIFHVTKTHLANAISSKYLRTLRVWALGKINSRKFRKVINPEKAAISLRETSKELHKEKI
jgi:hypothetical protein